MDKIYMRKSYWIVCGIILLSFAIGIYYYNQMPDKIASHWNFKGDVDSYMSKFWGLFLMPIILLVLFLLFLLIPKIDPLKANIAKFRRYFDGFVIMIFLFLLYIYLLTTFWNIGIRFNMALWITPAFAVLSYYCGILVENAKRNWFIGIRTPWTLSSEKVWDKTHKLGGILFKFAAVISLFGLFFPRYTFFLVIVPMLFVAFYTIVYSYFQYKKIK